MHNEFPNSSLIIHCLRKIQMSTMKDFHHQIHLLEFFAKKTKIIKKIIF